MPSSCRLTNGLPWFSGCCWGHKTWVRDKGQLGTHSHGVSICTVSRSSDSHRVRQTGLAMPAQVSYCGLCSGEGPQIWEAPNLSYWAVSALFHRGRCYLYTVDGKQTLPLLCVRRQPVCLPRLFAVQNSWTNSLLQRQAVPLFTSQEEMQETPGEPSPNSRVQSLHFN